MQTTKIWPDRSHLTRTGRVNSQLQGLLLLAWAAETLSIPSTNTSVVVSAVQLMDLRWGVLQPLVFLSKAAFPRPILPMTRDEFLSPLIDSRDNRPKL